MHVSRLSLGVAVLSAALITGCSNQAASAERTYPMGEKITVGPFLYTVFDTQWLTHLGMPPDEKVPQNRFFLVRVSIVNSSSNEVMVPTLSVEDDKGTSYPEVTTDVGAPQWIGLLRQMHPANSIAGNLVFDCPPGHYKLRVLDDNGEKSALIDIPLTFTSESPDVPTPGESKKDPGLLKK
jgi:hypothetical protein